MELINRVKVLIFREIRKFLFLLKEKPISQKYPDFARLFHKTARSLLLVFGMVYFALLLKLSSISASPAHRDPKGNFSLGGNALCIPLYKLGKPVVPSIYKKQEKPCWRIR